MMSHRWRVFAVASLFALAGCGGGGGGGGGGNGGGGGGGGGGGSNFPLTISLTQNTITGSVPQIELPSEISFTATVAGTTSASTIFVVIADSANTFSGTPGVTQVNATQYQATLPLPDTLSMGDYSGNLTISLCADAACATVLGRKTAPYSVTIAENPVISGSFSRASVTLTAVADDDVVTYPMILHAPVIPYISHAKFSDDDNVLRVAGDSQTISAPLGSATNFSLSVSPDLPPGTYSGSLDVTFCRGESCERAYRGETTLPYTVTVYAQTNLKTLAPLAGATDWTALQGSSARTGHVPVTLNPADFSPRWLWRSPDPATLTNVLEPVNAAGKVFTVAAPESTFAITPILFALDEASGAVSWQQSIPDPGTGPWNGGLGPFMPPVIAGNHVYLARTVGSYPDAEGTLLAFGTTDGTPAFAPPIFANTPGEFAEYTFEQGLNLNWIGPAHLTPRADSILLTSRADDFSSTQLATDLATGAPSAPWESCIASLASPAFAGAAAVDANGDTYLATNEGLLLADSCETIATPTTLADGYGPVAVPGTSTVIVVSQGNLLVLDTAAREIKWSALKADNQQVYVGSPAVAGDSVFLQNNASFLVQLEARNIDSGELLWTWQPPWSDETSFRGNVVSTDNLVFVSTRRAVYAIDRTTHQAVWTYPYPGKISISANGVLYVRRGFLWSGTGIAAINLQ
jgi:outer membrane protein assembly factor BamB